MRRPNLRIRVQSTVSVCLFTLVCLVSLAVVIYVLARNTLLDLQVGNLDLNSRMLREECRQEFSDIYESFSRLSYSSPVKDIYNNYTSEEVITKTADSLHDSFGLDRILMMKSYLANGTEILEVDSKMLVNRSGLPQELLPLTYTNSSDLNATLSRVIMNDGEFVGPSKAQQPIGGTNLMLSLTLPIRLERSPDIVDLDKKSSSFNTTIGYGTFMINASKLQKILTSVSLSSATSEVGTAALCAARNNYTSFDQLIPFNDNTSQSDTQSIAGYMSKTKTSSDLRSLRKDSTTGLTNLIPAYRRVNTALPYDSDESFAIPPKMAALLSQDKTPTAEYNKGPQKSMISISPFTVLNSTYYVVVLQSHKGVFAMPHHSRDIIIATSCAIGAVMIIFTFLFVSFGARQILRLKMAATYEQSAPSKWKFLPLPWWSRPSNRKIYPDNNEKREMQVPEKVPLRKHVRDELDDITERFNAMSNESRKQCKRLEDRVAARKAEIEQAKEAADQANAAKSHFLARVTHELRNPLNGIIGTATLCLEDSNVDNIHNSLKTIFKCGELLLNLMVDSSSFSKTEVENMHLEPRDFTLDEITSQIQVIFTEQCSARKIGLVVTNNEPSQKYVFSGDTNRISQVIFNLMSNGIKFTPEGGQVQLRAEASQDDIIVEEEVRIEESEDTDDTSGKLIGDSSSSGDSIKVGENSYKHDKSTPPRTRKIKVLRRYKTLQFDVKDNGPGIAPDLQSRVFEEFVQGDISPHVKKSGVGLGLCICRQLAERMQGSVTLKSEVGHGSTFTFRLPLPYYIADSDSAHNTGDKVFELTSYASMLRSADLQPDAKSGRDAEQSTPEHSPGRNIDEENKEFSDSSINRTATKSPRSILPGTQKAREFLLRRKTSESINRVKPIADSDSKSKRNRSHSNSEKSTKEKSISGSGKSTSSSNSKTESSSPRSAKSENIHAVEFPPAPPVPRSPKESAATERTDGSNHHGPQGPYHTYLNSRLVTIMSDINPDVKTISRPPISSRNSFAGKPSPHLKVLVVDDNSVNQEVMMRMLNLEGLTNIKVANDGTEALLRIDEAVAEGSMFDVIFMDVQMPKMDGREATRIIRTERKMHMPIVAVSAFANETNADDCISAGMNLFLSKPLRRPHSREILRNLTSMTESTSSNEAHNS